VENDEQILHHFVEWTCSLDEGACSNPWKDALDIGVLVILVMGVKMPT